MRREGHATAVGFLPQVKILQREWGRQREQDPALWRELGCSPVGLALGVGVVLAAVEAPDRFST